MTYQVEYTDTFNGDANYSWVRRARIPSPSWDTFKDWDGNGRREPRTFQRTVMRRAKAAVGISGLRGRTYALGDGYEFRPYGCCTVLFVTWTDSDASDD